MATNSGTIRTVYRFAWLVIAALCVIGTALIFAPPLNRHRKLQSEKAAKELESRQLDESIADLKTRQQRFQTDRSFVERTAREMGMVKPDEVILVPTASDGARPQ